MTEEDIPAGMRLKSMAGWNQLAGDWEMLLDAASGGCFVAVEGDDVVGTVTTVDYEGRFNWVGMALVDPAMRGRGVGTQLLRAAIDYGRELGTVRLDATPAGKGLYDTLGFVDEYELTRMTRDATANAEDVRDEGVRAIVAKDLPAIAEFDAPIFGADRMSILTSLNRAAPNYGWVVENDNEIAGYTMGHPGANFDQIGPIIADSDETARRLLDRVLVECAGKPVVIDVLNDRVDFVDLLREKGFTAERPFTRMRLGELAFPGMPAKQYAIAGPEIG